MLAPGVAGTLQGALQRAATTRTADFLLAQLNGVFEHELRHLRSLTEIAVSGTSSPRHVADLTCRLDHLLRWSEFGRHLTHPWQVVLAGRANVGKSSLINAILGFSRSIVFDEPGTTRDVVTADTAVNGWPVCLSDTAGLRTGGDSLEYAGMARTREQLARADCRLIVIAASEPLQAEDRELLHAWPDALAVANKSDLPPHSEWAERVPNGIRVSALTGMGLDRLLERIADTLVPEVPSLDQPLPVCELHAEAIRRARAALDADEVQFEACLGALDELLSGDPA